MFKRKVRFQRKEQLANNSITASIHSRQSRQNQWAWLLYGWIKSQNSLSWEGSLELSGPTSDSAETTWLYSGPWLAKFETSPSHRDTIATLTPFSTFGCPEYDCFPISPYHLIGISLVAVYAYIFSSFHCAPLSLTPTSL